MKNLFLLSLIIFLYSFSTENPNKNNNTVIDICDYLDEDQER